LVSFRIAFLSQCSEGKGMAKAPRKSPVRTEKPEETDFRDKVLSATLERVDSFGSYAAGKVDSLGGVSKEIRHAVGRCLGD